jgi:hypothetical protein
MTTKKKLTVLSKPTPAAFQRELAVKPVASASGPEFPTRGDMYRAAGIGMIGGATLLVGGIASADAQKPAAPPPPPPPQQQAKPADKAPNPTPVAELQDGSVDGQPLAKAAPKFKVYREGGGIGPAEDMWNLEDIESFVSWTMAKEGKLNLQTNYKLELDGLKLNLDGFDPDRNIGFEYIDSKDPESSTYSAATRAKLDAWMKSQKVAILFIEVKKLPDTATLRGKVVKFLNQVKKTPPNPGKIMTAAPGKK